MDASDTLDNLIVLNLVLLLGVAIPHLIDDFLYGIPAEFGLSNPQAQLLAGLFTIIGMLVLLLVIKQKRSGYIAAGTLGIFLALAGILRHLPMILRPEPYWSGLFSESLIIVLILSGLSLSALSFFVLRVKRIAPRQGAE
jgi:hypothetical protein